MPDLRRRASVPFSVSLARAGVSADAGQPVPVLTGLTRDMRATGVSLVVSSFDMGGQSLLGEGQLLSIVLELPNGPVEMQAVAVRSETLEDTESEGAYLFGVRITEMSDEDCLRFVKYLRTLR